MNDASPGDFRPAATIQALKTRALMLRRLREFFDSRDFFEVTTPVLSADTVVDLHLDPFRVTVFEDPRQPDLGPTWYLQTSPEFHMKRLVAAGAESIYQIGPAFRGAESGPLHNIEFTMVEWYRVGDDMAAGIDLLSEVAATLLGKGAADRISYADAFQQHTGINPHTSSDEELISGMSKFRTANTDSRNDCLDVLWSHAVEPHLGQKKPTIVFDYPAAQSALAKVRQDKGAYLVAERFELYFHGVELANGYHELTDPAEFKSRMQRINRERIQSGKPPLPEDNRLIQAMENNFPPTTGVALGFDRVVMLALGADSLEKSLCFPIDRA